MSTSWAVQNILIPQGADWEMAVTWKSGGEPVDLTGYTAQMQIRASAGGPLLAEPTVTVTAPLEGTFTATMTAAETAALDWVSTTAVYDVLLTAPGGQVYRKLAGRANLSPGVTQ